MTTERILKKKSPLKKLTEFFKKRWMRENSPHSEEKSFQLKQLSLDLVLVVVGFAIAFAFVVGGAGLKSLGEKTKNNIEKSIETINDTESKKNGSKIELPISKIVLFDKKIKSGKSVIKSAHGLSARAQGTLVKVKLLNRLEVLSTVPAFVQVIDYSLGKNLYGKTILGDATSDENSRKITIDFSHAKLSSRTTIGLKGQALSLDGTLGLRARRLMGFGTRTALSSARGAGELTSRPNNNLVRNSSKETLEGVLVGALLKGLGEEVKYEQRRGHTLILNPGHEFFVKLTQTFPRRH